MARSIVLNTKALQANMGLQSTSSMETETMPTVNTAPVVCSEPATAVVPASSVALVASIEAAQIKKAQMGDLAAFDWLIARYRQRAIRLATQVLRRPAEAEDLVQEAFLRAFAQIKTFRNDCAFYTWLYRIIVRLCLNRMRSPVWVISRNVRTLVGLDGSRAGVQMTSSPAPSENRVLVEKLLDSLSPILRTTLILREIEGLEYEEIAQTLNVPVGTVRSRLSAARSQFQALWLQIQEETHNV